MKKIFLLIFSFVSISLFGDTLSLKDAIDATLKNYPDVKLSKLKIQQSKASYDAAFSQYLPSINLQANYNGTQTFVFPLNGSFHTVDDMGWSAGVAVAEKIWDFNKREYGIDASKIDTAIAKLSLDELKALLIYKVKSLYGLMLVQKEAVIVREKDMQTKEAYYKQSLALVEEGLKTEADASRFLSSLLIAKDNLSIAKASFDKAKNSLSLYMGREIKDDVTLEKHLLEDGRSVEIKNKKDFLSNNYQIKIYTQTIDKNKLLHKSARASHFGSFDAVASYTHVDTLNSYDSKLLGVTLNIPLYSGGRISAETQKALIGAKIASEQKNTKLLELQEELENLLIDIKRYEHTIQAKIAQEKSAQKTLDVLEGRYKEGLSTYIEVLDATSLVLNAKLGLLEAYYSKNIALSRVDYLQGKIQ